jgi:hypothetical protein
MTMMTRTRFLAAFDAERWLTGPEVLDRLDQADFWPAWWRRASQALKLAYVASVCWRTVGEDGLPVILAIDRGEGETHTIMYKPRAALTAGDYVEVRRFFDGLARYERRAATIAAALAVKMAGEEVVEGDDADV